MMADSSFPGITEFWPALFGLAGSLVSLRYLVEATPTGRTVSVIISFIAQQALVPAAAEVFHWGPNVTAGAAFVIGFLAANLLGALWTASAGLRDAPLRFISDAWALFRGNKP